MSRRIPSTRRRTSSDSPRGQEVDVTGAVVGSLEDDGVHELDRRCIGDAVGSLQVDDVVLVVLVAVPLLSEQMGTGLRLLAAGESVELVIDIGRGGDGEVDRIAADES